MEGFYGRPFSAAHRRALIGLLSLVPKPAYVYAPKDDPWHRLAWREPYPPGVWAGLSSAMREARRRGVRLVFGISPWEFRDGEHRTAFEKLGRAAEEGAGGLAVLFDDIGQPPSPGLAERQAAFAAEAAGSLGLPVTICPSVYCLSQAGTPGAAGYLETLSRLAPPDWDIFWTGDDVIPRTLDVASLERAEALLGRRPAVWDNLLADDYTIRRVFLGSLEGRPVGLAGYYLNPSGRYRAAWEQAGALVSAAGAVPPASPIACPGLDLMRGLHWTPWECGETGRMVLETLASAMEEEEPRAAIGLLGRMSADLEALLGLLARADGGIDLAPQVHDTARFLTVAGKCLAEPRDARAPAARRLLLERLPFEHPLADMMRGLARGGPGTDGGRGCSK